MNRLWVRMSLILALVVVVGMLFPLAIRRLWPRSEIYHPPTESLPPDFWDRGGPPEDFEAFQDRFSEQVWQTTWITVIVGSVLSLGVGVWLSRVIVKPLIELEKGAKAVAAHNLAYRVPEAGTVEMRSMARAFNEMAAELERSETLRRNMLADVTHELRHPVQVLRGNLQGILDGVFPLSIEEIVFLSDQTLHLMQLTMDLHDLALAEARELPMYPQLVALDEVVQDSIEAVFPLAVEKNIELKVDLPAQTVWGLADAGRLRQAIRNLLSNGIRYTPEGGKVSVSLAQVGEEVQISVRDTGIGIAEKDLPFVFDRFYRTDASRNRDSGGTGLGLAITKAIVEAHQGTVTAESGGVNHGSRFMIVMPAQPPPATDLEDVA